ncbi:MAG: ABC transporter permease, partial [Pseudorhodoplanes sp.]
MKNRLIPLLILPAALLLVVVFGYPVVWLLMRSFSDPQWGLQNFEVLLTRPVYLKTLWNTVAISGTVTLVCAVLGYPLAYSMANGSELTKRLLLFAVLIPFWTSILVRAFAWVVLLQRQGLVNSIMINLGIISDPLVMLHNRTGTLIGMVQVLLPFMVLPLYSVMLRVDGRLLQAASVLGAN